MKTIRAHAIVGQKICGRFAANFYPIVADITLIALHTNTIGQTVFIFPVIRVLVITLNAIHSAHNEVLDFVRVFIVLELLSADMADYRRQKRRC